MKYVIANWKMGPLERGEAERLTAALTQELQGGSERVTVVLCPPFPWLPLVGAESRMTSRWRLGAQDAFWEERGPFTGEVSLSMLRSLTVQYVIVGHSERRALGDTNEIVGRKLRAVLSSGMTAVLCVGEIHREGDWHVVFREQVAEALGAIEAADAGKLIVTYEPVWAIGGSIPDTPDDVLSAVLFIRKLLRERFGERAASSVPILYGGSIEGGTVAPFANQEGIDGVLVGHASLNAKGFADIVRAIGEA